MRISAAFVGLGLAVVASACTAPRGITTSGKVTPQGEFRLAYNQGFNVGSAPLSKAGTAVRDAASQLGSQAARGDTVRYSGTVSNVQAAALAYLLDPVQTTADLSIRYGVVPRLDVGYKYAFGSHVFDTQYQLLGPTGSVENPERGAASGTTYASIGLQYAIQRAALPSLPFLSDINSLLGLSASRHDILIPLTVSQSFGPEESIGAISYGAVYAHSWVSYGFTPSNLYNRAGTGVLPALDRQSRNFSSYGAFLNLKLGYKYVYVVPAVSLYYQNYGNYTLLDGSTTSLSGVTVIPSLGLQFRIPNMR
ncbi:hypothetical protein E4631_00525 [Hymenobacter sp. UV11]|uniref:hypothetical protein n=1 Tax=Hymenobacter sp. UV11 TaxID=1849735 RepID=UPI00105D1167|nr:hypothetical protein [Hymenobacter sp. UV11]TDN37404.1 hypothetical protein A8B98_02355 [Hymenobacter sp. UV11]TFZ68591.1 hypothetical protein E4631_00525 [Hymenobacter sp. UV11]